MMEELISQLNEDLENMVPISQSITDADLVEITTVLPQEENCDPGKETEQHLYLSPRGQVTFRSFTYGKGPGKRGIGRYEKTNISPSAALEILQLLDTFLYLRRNENWKPDAASGSWMVRTAREGEGTEMTAGALQGAVVDGMDLSFMIRTRIPIPDLFLFDPEEGNA